LMLDSAHIRSMQLDMTIGVHGWDDGVVTMEIVSTVHG
jgi:hypothetical protein